MVETHKQSKALVWDCNSSLYDSFELKSFERELDSAILSSSRSLSMPRLFDPSRDHPAPKMPKKASRISRSFLKLVRSIFGSRQGGGATASWFKGQSSNFAHDRGFRFFYDGSGALTTIPEEVCVSPEIGPKVGKAVSERFTTTRVGISCA